MNKDQNYKKLYILFLALGCFGLGLIVACSADRAAIEEWRKPRKDLPIFQKEPLPPKPLVGLFVDANQLTTPPDGKSWATAFPTIQQGIDASVGQDIIVAAGVYRNPNIVIRDRLNIRLVGGYKSGEKFEKERDNLSADEIVVLDGELNNNPLVRIEGNSQRISFAGGFSFINVRDTSAVVMRGIDALNPLKEVSFINSQFINNQNPQVGSVGGGIHGQFVEDLELNNLTSNNNLVTDRGGFVYLGDIKGLSMMSGTYKNNRADIGGAVYLVRIERLSFSKAAIEENRAQEGGGVFIDSVNNYVLSDVSFARNQGLAGPGFGAGLKIKDCRDVHLLGLTFIDNKLSMTDADNTAGGALHIVDSTAVTMRFGDGVIRGNDAVLGGAIAITKVGATAPSNIVLEGGSFHTNHATRRGGDIYANRVRDLSLNHVNFTDGRAHQGGSLFVHKPAVRLSLDKITIKGSKAVDRPGLLANAAYGGCFYLNGRYLGLARPQVSITNSEFVDCEARSNGGAMMARNISYEVKFEKTLFKNNRTDQFGGALALDAESDANSRFIIGEGVKFFSNYARRGAGGGAIYAVFNPAHVNANLMLPPLPALNRKLVFLNTARDHGDNSTGQVLTPAVIPNSAGQYANFLRAGIQDVADVALPVTDLDAAGVLRGLPALPNIQIWLLERLVSYSLDPADPIVTAPWNQLKLNWQGATSTDVFAW